MPRLSPSLDMEVDRVFIVVPCTRTPWRRRHPTRPIGCLPDGADTYPGYSRNGEKEPDEPRHHGKEKLLNRLRRMRGQIDAIERAIEADRECAQVLQQATACRGALEGFIAEVLEDHIREHLVDPAAPDESRQRVAADELIRIVHAYLT